MSDRLESIRLEPGEAARAIPDLSRDAGFQTLRRAATRAKMVEAIGVGVAESDGELGVVELSAKSHLVQHSFRRFAADVAAPLAEKIHRTDLTTPETILQSLREMGAFGLAIPEELSGSAQHAGDDNARALAVTDALSEPSLGAEGGPLTGFSTTMWSAARRARQGFLLRHVRHGRREDANRRTRLRRDAGGPARGDPLHGWPQGLRRQPPVLCPYAREAGADGCPVRGMSPV